MGPGLSIWMLERLEELVELENDVVNGGRGPVIMVLLRLLLELDTVRFGGGG